MDGAMRIIVIALLVAACDSPSTEPSFTPSELYTLICVDSTLVHPLYNCDFAPDVTGASIHLEIENPNPNG